MVVLPTSRHGEGRCTPSVFTTRPKTKVDEREGGGGSLTAAYTARCCRLPAIVAVDFCVAVMRKPWTSLVVVFAGVRVRAAVVLLPSGAAVAPRCPRRHTGRNEQHNYRNRRAPKPDQVYCPHVRVALRDSPVEDGGCEEDGSSAGTEVPKPLHYREVRDWARFDGRPVCCCGCR